MPEFAQAARLADAVGRELAEMLRRLKAQLAADVYGQVVNPLAADQVSAARES